MNIQKSFEKDQRGTVYIVPTPIGNLADMTYRAVATLESVDVIAAEDTRNTIKLLNHFEIKTALLSYHEHNKAAREVQLIEMLEAGKSIALVSDAGMPGISDPGYELVQAAILSDLKVVVLPGANAALCALIGSGLPTDEFLFYGFLPRKNKEKQAELERLKQLQATILFYESPYRVKETLQTLLKIFGDRKLSIARELTKRYEEYVRGDISEVLNWTKDNELKGEFCLVVHGNLNAVEEADDLWWEDLSIKEHVNYYIDTKNTRSKEAIKHVAADRKLPSREIYQLYHLENDES